MVNQKLSEHQNKDHTKINIIEKEQKSEGEVTIWTWFKFFSFGSSLIGISLIFVFGAISGASNILINYYIGVWLEKPQTEERNKLYFNVFWVLIVIFFLSTTFKAASIYLSLLISSSKIHKAIVWKILRAPSKFLMQIQLEEYSQDNNFKFF